MADRSLRGMRLGAQSLQSEEGVEFSPRKKSMYRTADGTTFEVIFAADAEIPEVWESPEERPGGHPARRRRRARRCSTRPTTRSRARHWDMLLERRTRAELEELLEERLDYLRARRGQQKIGA